MTMHDGARRVIGVLVAARLVLQLGGSALAGGPLGSGSYGGSSTGIGSYGGSSTGIGGTAGISGMRGGSTYGGSVLGPRPIDQLERAVRQAPPSAGPQPAPRNDMVWVPDRYLDRPEGTFHVPAHYEQRLNPQEHYVPPLYVCNVGTGACAQVAPGVRPPPDLRLTP